MGGGVVQGEVLVGDCRELISLEGCEEGEIEGGVEGGGGVVLLGKGDMGEVGGDLSGGVCGGHFWW